MYSTAPADWVSGYKGVPTFPKSISLKVNKIAVRKKSMRTAIKQDLSPDLNPFDYAVWDVLESKTKATSHLNIGSLKTAIKEKWN